MQPRNGKNLTVVLTGATSGVGWGAARTLVAGGCRVVALARNVERARERCPGVEAVECDLASRASVVRAADAVLARCERIDVLLGCAGVAPWRRRESTDGFELTWATNILGHALLTERLRERLVASAPSRVVMISGNAHRSAALRWHDLQLREGYSVLAAGKQAALAKILWTYAVARELDGSGVTVNTFCPAFVRSGLTRDFPWWVRPLVGLGQLFAQSEARGARTPVWLATSAEVEGVTGKYFRHGAERDSSAASHERETQARMLSTVREMLRS